MLCPCIYRALFVQYYIYARIKNVPLIFFSFAGLISCILSIGLALGVIFAVSESRSVDAFRFFDFVQVGFLLVVQLRSIFRNQTGIENWILRKAQDRNHRRLEPFVYPYHLGFRENLRQVFNWRETFNVIGDGLSWPVAVGCDEYALTREQLEQKKDKRQRTVRYEVVKSFAGSFVTCRYGCRTAICIPCSDEPRVSIEKGDFVLVTRWERFWMYGERVERAVQDEGEASAKKLRGRRRPRGWFPRSCIYEAFRMEDLWSGKIEPNSEVVQAQFSNFGPEGYDENDAEPTKETAEESQSKGTDFSTSSGSSKSSSSSDSSPPPPSPKKVRQRKVPKAN